MKFKKQLIHGRLERRYKRFLADMILDDGRKVTAHCTNSGSMRSCLEEGAEVWLSPVDDPGRKTQFTWEMIRIGEGWVGINTSNPNALAMEWVSRGLVPGLEGLTNLKREVRWEDSRFDLYGEMPSGGDGSADGDYPAKEDGSVVGQARKCFIEVKNVSLKEGVYALFPDAVTERGRKHLNTLVRVKRSGMRALMLYIVQRMDVQIFSPARQIDPAYGKALDKAVQQGVEIIVVQAMVSPKAIEFHRVLPVEL